MIRATDVTGTTHKLKDKLMFKHLIVWGILHNASSYGKTKKMVLDK